MPWRPNPRTLLSNFPDIFIRYRGRRSTSKGLGFSSSIVHKLVAFYHSSRSWRTKPMPPRPKINEEDIEEAFLKGSGPGGQKINKTSSAVQLKHIPTGIVVKSQATRSRSQNRKIARTNLAERLELLEKGDQSRIAIKAETQRRKKASSSKKSRRKYRALKEQDKSEVHESKVDEGTLPSQEAFQQTGNEDNKTSQVMKYASDTGAIPAIHCGPSA